MKLRGGPYINFQGRAREAMELYQTVPGGKFELYAAGMEARRARRNPATASSERLSGDDFLVIGSEFVHAAELLTNATCYCDSA